MRKLTMLSASLATALSLAACGGGGNDPAKTSDNATDAPSPTLKLADPANDHAIAKKATAYTLFAARDVYLTYLSSLHSVLNGANYSGAGTATQSCEGGGTATITMTDADNSRSITAGDSASIHFANCTQSVSTSNGVVSKTLNGDMSFVMKSVNGIIGSGGDYAFTADSTASNLNAASDGTTVKLNGTMTIAEKHSPANGTASAVATTNSIVITRTKDGKDDGIMLANWTENDDYASQTNIDTVSVTGKLDVKSSDGKASVAVSTLTPIMALAGTSLTSGSLKLATTTDSSTVTAEFAGNANVTLAVDAGSTGLASVTLSTNTDELASLIGS